MGSSNENSGYGPVRNPWDRGRVPGGSSGGSAAAVAGRLAPWAIGTDTGGSIRQPAALCGIVGLKPTYGAISRYGMVAFASSLDQCGPLTRTVADAALLLRAMEGRDRHDSTSVGIEGGVELPSRDRPRAACASASPATSPITPRGSSPGSPRSSSARLALIERLGGELEEITLPNAEHGISAYYVIAPAEASSNLQRYDGVRYGIRETDGDLDGMYERTRARGFGAEVKRRIMLGTYALSSGYYEAYYGRAQKVRTKIAERLRDAFGSVDLVVTPTSPSVAFELGARTADPLAMYLSDYFTVPMSLAGIPAISIPAGLATPPGLRGRAPGRPADRRPGVRRVAAARRRPRPGGGDRVRAMTEAEWEPVIGLEIHVQLSHPHEDVLRLRAVVRRRPERPHLPDLPRPPRHAAGAERAGDPLRDPDRARARLRDRPALDLSPQELLLSRQPEGVPDQPVRLPAVRPAAGSATSASTASTSRRTRRSWSTSPPPAGSTSRAPRWSTSTAAARRWSRSSPSPTCTTPRRRASGCSCCGRRSASSASRT